MKVITTCNYSIYASNALGYFPREMSVNKEGSHRAREIDHQRCVSWGSASGCAAAAMGVAQAVPDGAQILHNGLAAPEDALESNLAMLVRCKIQLISAETP
jgi:hypothetical protein